ncbi:MAG: DUF1844 domain-containing protein [Gemmatimonadales bacterium]
MNPHFASLVLGLAHQAEAALAGNLPPGAEQAKADPRAIAQALIDTLTMLRDKTAGRLDADEAKLLGDAITALQFRFVQQGGAPVQ